MPFLPMPIVDSVLDEPFPSGLGAGFLSLSRTGRLTQVSPTTNGLPCNVRLQPRWPFDEDPRDLFRLLSGRGRQSENGFLAAIELSVAPSGDVVILRSDLGSPRIKLFSPAGAVIRDVANPFVGKHSILSGACALLSDSEVMVAYYDRLALSVNERRESDAFNGPQEFVKMDVRLAVLRVDSGSVTELFRSRVLVKQGGLSSDYLFSSAVSSCGKVAYVRLFDRLVTIRRDGKR